MKNCECKKCYFPATHKCEFYKIDEKFSKNLCEKHMTDLLIDGLAYRRQYKFRIISIIPIED